MVNRGKVIDQEIYELTELLKDAYKLARNSIDSVEAAVQVINDLILYVNVPIPAILPLLLEKADSAIADMKQVKSEMNEIDNVLDEEKSRWMNNTLKTNISHLCVVCGGARPGNTPWCDECK